MKQKKIILFLLIIVFNNLIYSQNFSGGFNFNMPPIDTFKNNFLPFFPVDPITSDEYVSINLDGHFSVKNNPIRFWGTNLVADGAFPDKYKAFYIAGRLRKLGHNLVRFHHIDNPWSSRSLFSGMTSTRQLNSLNLDNMEYLIAELKKNGIYVNMNLNVSRTFKKTDGIPEADSLLDYAKGLTIFDPQMIFLQKEYAKQLLTHFNPYTRLTLAEDPVLSLVEIINENSLYLLWRSNKLKHFSVGGVLPFRHTKMLDSLWNDFLWKKYSTTQNLANAWNNGLTSSSNNNLINNGDFETSTSNWYIELHNGALASLSKDTSTAFSGKSSAKVIVSNITGTEWHIQFNQSGFSLKKDSIYTVEFAAKANGNKNINLTLMRNNSPYTYYNGKDFALSSDWKIFSLTFKVTEENLLQSRISFGFKNQLGTYWFDNLSLKPASTKGILDGESFENKNIKRIDYSDCYSFSDQRVKDQSEFYIKLHDNFYSDMKNYLVNELKIKVPIVGTNWNFGPGDQISQSKYDFIDNHSYWQHPDFPHIPWSATDWKISNTSMVKDPNGGTIAGLFGGVPHTGKPYTISEYNHAYPNRYQTEMMLFSTAYLSFHDADGIEFFDYNGSNDYESDFVPGFFDMNRNPALMSLSPSCALAFKDNYIAKAKKTIKINYNPSTVFLLPKNDNGNWWGIDLYSKKLSLIHSLKNESFTSDSTTNFSLLPNEPVSPYKTDTDEIVWDTQGLFSVNTPKFIGVTGFLNSFPGKTIGKLQLKSSNDFGTLTWISLTEDSLINSSKSLLTISSKVQNTGMIWEGTTTVHNNWGKAPTLMSPINILLRLNINSDSIKIYPLDAAGNEQPGTTKTIYPVSKGIYEFNIDQNIDKTLWYGIEAFNSLLSNNEQFNINHFSLEQNYPNPFNPATTIKFSLAERAQVIIKVYNAIGKEVAVLLKEEKEAGNYQINFDGSKLTSGIYYYNIVAGNYNSTKKMILIK